MQFQDGANTKVLDAIREIKSPSEMNETARQEVGEHHGNSRGLNELGKHRCRIVPVHCSDPVSDLRIPEKRTESLGINPDILLPQYFEKVELKTTIDNKYFRENGTKIYLCESPTEEYKKYYRTRIKELKRRYR